MTSHTALALTVVAVLLIGAAAHAQNRYYEDYANGISLQAGWVTADEAEGFGGAVALTLNGRFDVGVTYMTPETEVEPGTTVDWQEVTPRVGIALVRPRPRVPVGVDVVAGYGFLSAGGMQQGLVGGNSQTFGLDVYGCFGKGSHVRIMPTVGIYRRQTEIWSRGYVEDPKQKMTVEGLMIGVELAFLFEEKFLIVPSTSTFEGDTTWAIMAGLALALE